MTLNKSGFTLIEILMVLVLIGVLSLLSVELISDSVNESRFQETISKMNQIKIAMIGNPEILANKSRTDFGFLGDLGKIPSPAQGLLALTVNNGYPPYMVDQSIHFGMGWNGPYLSASGDATLDAWGTAFAYDPDSNPATLISYGADQVVGGTGLNQDITVSIPSEAMSAEVQGFVCDHGGPFSSDVEVELNAPDGAGTLIQSQVSVAPVDQGHFSFSGVPFGVRSLTLYVPSKAAATQTVGPVLLTLDKPNYLVPCSLIDVNP